MGGCRGREKCMPVGEEGGEDGVVGGGLGHCW